MFEVKYVLLICIWCIFNDMRNLNKMMKAIKSQFIFAGIANPPRIPARRIFLFRRRLGAQFRSAHMAQSHFANLWWQRRGKFINFILILWRCFVPKIDSVVVQPLYLTCPCFYKSCIYRNLIAHAPIDFSPPRLLLLLFNVRSWRREVCYWTF